MAVPAERGMKGHDMARQARCIRGDYLQVSQPHPEGCLQAESFIVDVAETLYEKESSGSLSHC